MTTDATTTDTAPAFNLADYAHPHVPGEWRYDAPDENGHVANVHRGFRRDELPQLIAFLTAVYAASGPDTISDRLADEICGVLSDAEPDLPTVRSERDAGIRDDAHLPTSTTGATS